MPWEPLADWGPLDSDFDELSPPSTKEGVALEINIHIILWMSNYVYPY